MSTRRIALVRAACGVAVLAHPACGQAQGASRPRRVASVNAGADIAASQQERDEVWRRLGWEPGRTLLIERHVAAGRIERLPGMVDAALRFEPDVLVGIGEAAAHIARRRALLPAQPPLVFAWAFMPREAGLVGDFARPDRHATGLAVVAGLETSMKLLQLLRAVAPGARRLSLMALHPTLFTVSGEPLPIEREWAEAARAQGFEPHFNWLRRSDELDRALADVVAQRPQALLCSSSVLLPGRERIAALVRQLRVPAATQNSELFAAGLHLYYGPSRDENRRLALRLAQIVDRVLRGAQPADIPVEFPNRYALVVNQRAARAAGLAVPASVLLQADEVIE